MQNSSSVRIALKKDCGLGLHRFLSIVMIDLSFKTLPDRESGYLNPGSGKLRSETIVTFIVSNAMNNVRKHDEQFSRGIS